MKPTRTRPERVVMKFGGGVLSTPRDFERLHGILKINEGRHNALVVSALQGMTDHLIRYAKRPAQSPSAFVQTVRERHAPLGVGETLEPHLDDLETLARTIHTQGHAEPGTPLYDRFVGTGERLSAVCVAHFLNSKGLRAQAIQADDAGIVTTNRSARPACDLKATKSNLKPLVGMLEDGVIPVVTGFFGRAPDGQTALLGRGGSDYTAGIVAHSLDADKLEMWKDVSGFKTADPRVVITARTHAAVTHKEVEELSGFGSKILHPRTLEPIRDSGIDVVLKHVDAPEQDGTRLVKTRSVSRGGGVTAIAHRRNVSVITVHAGVAAEGPGFASSVFGALSTHGVNIDQIATSQHSISFTADKTDEAKARQALSHLSGEGVDNVSVLSDMALVGIVGPGLENDTAGITGRALSALSKKRIPVRLVSSGVSQSSFNMLVPETHLERAVKLLHSTFRLHRK